MRNGGRLLPMCVTGLAWAAFSFWSLTAPPSSFTTAGWALSPHNRKSAGPPSPSSRAPPAQPPAVNPDDDGHWLLGRRFRTQDVQFQGPITPLAVLDVADQFDGFRHWGCFLGPTGRNGSQPSGDQGPDH